MPNLGPFLLLLAWVLLGVSACRLVWRIFSMWDATPLERLVLEMNPPKLLWTSFLLSGCYLVAHYHGT